jgi:HK97 family phage major capsid protein
VWFINQAVEPQLNLLTLGDLGVYFPAGSFANAPEDRLFGRPVIPVEQCSALGTVGDIVLADLSEYVMIDKGSVQMQSSIHVRFLYDEQVLKFTYRVDGQPVWNSALTPYKGSSSLSPFVGIETR